MLHKGGKMEIADIIKLLVDNGVTIAILAYFCFRDYKFMQTLTDLLSSLKTQSERLAEILEKEDA